MATIIGDLAVRIGADTAGLTKGLGVARKRVNQFASDTRRGAATMAKYTAAAGAAAGAVALITKRTIEANRETANLAKLANSSVSTFSKMSFAAKSVGVEQSKLADILKDTSDRVGDFLSTGGGPMADFFENIAPKIGVTAEEFRNLSGPQALQKYVNGLQRANLSQSEMTFYMEAIASDATALLPLLRNNGEAMEEQARKAERLGLALSNVESAKIEEAARVMDQVAEVGSSFLDQLTAEFAPVISGLGRQFIGLAEDAGGVGEAAASSFNVVVDAVATVMNALDKMDRALLQSETAVDTFALSFRVGLLEIAREIVEIPTAAVNEMLMAIRKIPGFGDIDLLGMSSFGRQIQDQIDSTKEEIIGLNEVLRGELEKPLAGDNLKRLIADFKAAANESAAALAENGLTDGRGENTPGQSDEEETEKERMERQLKNRKKFAERMNHLEQQQAKQAVGWSEWSNEKKLNFTQSTLGDLTTLMNTENRKQFEIGKAAGIANALVSTYTGASKALELGWPAGPIAAAAITAKGFAQISSIRNQSFGGGGGGAAGGGGSATQNVNAQTEEIRRATSIDISLIGADSRDRAVAGSVISQINEAAERGERINRVALS